MSILTGKRILITGLTSKRSIAWGIAQSLKREGAQIALTYLGEKLRPRVEELAKALDVTMVLPCNVESDEEIDQLVDTIGQQWGYLDGIVHAIAFAPAEALRGDSVDNMTREAFRVAHDVSAYSFVALAKAARPLMKDRRASLITLSYLGANRTLPNYNVMGLAKASLEAATRYMAVALGKDGIRVNAISAGPIRTPAASGIGDFRKLLDYVANTSPLEGNVSIDQVGDTAAFLASDWSCAISGQVIYVDNGFNIVAMPQST